MTNANTETTNQEPRLSDTLSASQTCCTAKVLAEMAQYEVTLQCEKGHSQKEYITNPTIVQHTGDEGYCQDGLITLGEFYYVSGWHFCDGCEVNEEEDASRSDESVRNGQIEIIKALGYQAK